MRSASRSEDTVYDLILTGHILAGHQLDDVKKAVASLFQTDVTQVADLFLGRERTIKRRLARDKAESYVRTFEQAGAAVRIQASAPGKSSPESAPPLPPAPPSTGAGATHSLVTAAARAPSSQRLITSGAHARSSSIMLAVGFLIGLAVGFGVFGPLRTAIIGLSTEEQSQIKQLQGVLAETLTDIAAAEDKNRALAGGLTKVLVEARMEVLQGIKALLEQRIQAIRTGSLIRAEAPGQQSDPKRADQLARDIEEQRRDIEAARVRTGASGGLVGALGQATLATQEQTLAMLRLAYVSARYGLPAIQAKPETDKQSPPLGNTGPSVSVPGSTGRGDTELAVYEGPFGLKMGLPIKDLGGTEIPGAPGKYLLANVPVPHHIFANYIAEAAPTAGLCWIKGVSKPIETNRFGMSLRTEYEQLRDKLAKVYGSKFKETDALLPGSIWKDPGEWMMALRTKDRVLQATWDSSAGAGLPYDLSVVAIVVSASSGSEGYISVEYQFKNEPQCDAEISVNADVGLGSSKTERKAAEEGLAQVAEGADGLAAESANREAFRFGALIGERIEQQWIRPPGSSRGLECTLELRLEPTGDVVNGSVRVVSSSGSDEFDRSAVSAVFSAAPMPVPTGPAFELLRHFRFKFRP